MRLWETGSLVLKGRARGRNVCSVTDCGLHVKGHSLCGKHYQRMRKTGRLNLTARPSVLERFWSKVDESGGSDACHDWTAYLDENGYGKFGVAHGRTLVGAHVFAWMLAFGPPPPETPCVLHRCDRPRCVNVRHLFVGTQADNVADMWAKGRGSRSGGARGKGRQIARASEIRAAGATGETCRSIAARLGVHQTTVWRIITRRVFGG